MKILSGSDTSEKKAARQAPHAGQKTNSALSAGKCYSETGTYRRTPAIKRCMAASVRKRNRSQTEAGKEANARFSASFLPSGVPFGFR